MPILAASSSSMIRRYIWSFTSRTPWSSVMNRTASSIQLSVNRINTRGFSSDPWIRNRRCSSFRSWLASLAVSVVSSAAAASRIASARLRSAV